MMSRLTDLALHSALWSLLAVGGINATLADIQHYAVETRHWLTAQQFVTFFSAMQAAPGPNGMAVSLIGFQAAGLAGALVATLAMIIPSAVTVGLLACAAYVFIREVDVNVGRAVLTILTVVIAYRTKFNPIWLVAAGAALGLAGLVK
jgi:chromate transporter